MKVSYKWLLELTGLDWPVEEVANRLTLCGTACEYIEHAARYMDKVVVGEVLALNPVKGADKIQLATVDIGSGTMDVICGAPNVAVGQKVPVALEGAALAGDIVIKKVKIRGVESSAMICSERELGISDDHSGILVLDPQAKAGTPLVKELDFDDYTLTFELTPNRGDSMSAIGIARDLAALASRKVIKPKIELSETSEPASNAVKVTIDDPEGCPRYAARVIRNVKIGPSPWWLRKRLLLSGVRPISNVVDITNLVMLETGHPLHAFDLDRFGSDHVVVRKAVDGEMFTTLDGRKHQLTPEVLLITNGETGVAAGGVMGGLDSEVEDDTTNILLEAAYFDPATIRRSRKKIDLVTESSSRFEKGADPNGIPYAIDRAAGLLQQLCGGKVLSGVVDCYPRRIEPRAVAFRPGRCNYILGVDIAVDRMRQILTDLEMGVVDGDPMTVSVPTFRPDIEREIDLIEEVARIEGYDRIPDAITNVGPLFTPVHYEDRFKSEIRQLMFGSGFDEMVSHGMTDSGRSTLLHPELAQVKIINPVSEELNIMRNSMIPTILTAVSHNISHRNLDLCLFEVGKIYLPGSNQDDWVEEPRLVAAVTGNTEHTWRDRPRPFDYYDLSGLITRLAGHFGWAEIAYTPKKADYFAEAISYEISSKGEVVGIVGKLADEILDKFEIKQAVYVFELTLPSLMQQSGKLREYQPLPIYPAAPRDLAIVVDDDIRAGDLISAVKQAAGEIAETVEIFDLYRGKQIEKGKKSVAISITYRSLSGNLSSEQVDEKQRTVINKLKNDFNAQIRDK